MSRYLLQSDSNGLDLEYIIVENLLKKNKYLHDYKIIDTNYIMNIATKNDIPIGDIKFVSKWLQAIHNIDRENPIEIPAYLRTEEFLKRDYTITTWDKLPEHGKWFIKDISELKIFGSEVNTDYEKIKEWFEKPEYEFSTNLVLNKEHLFQVSSIFNILSEYRVYVIDGEIEAISNYNGDCTLLPDINLVKKAISMINYNEKWLKSYTLDIMVGKEGTAIIEVHNFTSVGLYNNIWGNNLLYAYKQGIDYLLNDNHTIVI